MPEKKGLSAFLKKNQKNKKAAGLAPDSANPDEDGLKEDVQAQEVDVGKNLAKETKNTPKDNHDDESSDEEEDDIGTGLRVGYIKEKKDVINKNKNTDENKKGYGLDDVPPSDSPAMASAVEKKVLGNVPKKTAESISFVGGKPKFGKKNKPGKFGDGFQAGLDDIDDEGNPIGKREESKPNGFGADGHREFINLGSAARSSAYTPATEETKESKPTPVKPTFRGKLNLTKTGGGGTNEDDNVGVGKTYDFSVTFKSASTGPRADGEGEGKKRNFGDSEGAGHMEQRRDRRHNNRGRGGFSGGFGGRDDDGDDGFEIVRNKKDVKKAGKKHMDDSESSEEESRFPSGSTKMAGGANIQRGGNRGGARGGRGGFFKNSKHAAAESSEL